MTRHEHLSDIFSYGVCTKTRKIWFDYTSDDDDTSSTSLDKLTRQISFLESLNSDPITIYMKNDGGCVSAGLAIHDFIKASPCYITIVGMDNLSSMGTVILQAADVRKVLPNTYLMIHEGTVSYDTNNPVDVDRWRELDRHQSEVCYEIYLNKIRKKHPKFTKAKLKTLLKHDTILKSPQEAIELGLVDSIEVKR